MAQAKLRLGSRRVSCDSSGGAPVSVRLGCSLAPRALRGYFRRPDSKIQKGATAKRASETESAGASGTDTLWFEATGLRCDVQFFGRFGFLSTESQEQDGISPIRLSSPLK